MDTPSHWLTEEAPGNRCGCLDGCPALGFRAQLCLDQPHVQPRIQVQASAMQGQ